MCWSETADLRAGIVLTALGVMSLGLVRHPRQFLLALCPGFLGVHQLVESQVWASLRDGHASNNWTLTWAVIAVPTLLICSPLATMIAFPEHWRRLVPGMVLGLVIAGVCSYSFAVNGVAATQNHHVLDYDVDVPFFLPQLLVYQFVSWGSFLLSGNRYVKQTGLAIGLAGGLAALVDVAAYESIWCAFGAVAIFMNIRWLRAAARESGPLKVADWVPSRFAPAAAVVPAQAGPIGTVSLDDRVGADRG